MFKNILLAIIAVAVVAASAVFIYQTVSTKSEKEANANALAQARRECSNQIHPQAEGDYVYGDYNKCMASKGFDEFKK